MKVRTRAGSDGRQCPSPVFKFSGRYREQGDMYCCGKGFVDIKFRRPLGRQGSYRSSPTASGAFHKLFAKAFPRPYRLCAEAPVRGSDLFSSSFPFFQFLFTNHVSRDEQRDIFQKINETSHRGFRAQAVNVHTCK